MDIKYRQNVCKLSKLQYRPKQAPLEWFEKINEFLFKRAVFGSFPYDPRCYVKRSEN